MVATKSPANHRPSGPFSLSRTRQWIVTVAATAASTYALDAIATAAGLLLIASGLLAGIGHPEALLFLAFSYVAWGAGLRINLRENWAMLEGTGTSTNVLSKVAYDVVKLRTGSRRARRIASDIGYVGTEFAKETPYYAGAFGAALFIDSVSAVEAIVFLGGANLGAALYEYGLARLVRASLRRVSGYASFETEWRPAAYLKEYYGAVEPDERATIAFFVDALKDVTPGEPVLVFGAGPTLHHVFLAAETASEVHLGEYLPANRREIERWLKRDARAHDWRPFVRYTLECEGLDGPAAEEITFREELTRARITRLMEVDLRKDSPLGDANPRRYGTVISAYCADSATDDKAEWAAYMRRIAGLVRPGGTLLVAALRHSRGYVVGGKTFPSPNVDEADLQAVLEPCFGRGSLTIQVCKLGGPDPKGYSSIMLASARDPRCIRATFSRRPVSPSPLPATPWVLAARSWAAGSAARPR
jgi:hypothetical protein